MKPFISELVHRRCITFPGWAVWSIGISGVLAVATLWLHQDSLTRSSQVNASTVEPKPVETSVDPEPGRRLQLTYEEWVALLGREAKVAAEKRPKRLTVLAGDSLSLWFPPDLLPTGVTWLNQGISGEISAGLLQRLRLFDQTQPETILVMVGINDLIRGVREETLLANHREIIRHLKMVHPRSKIIVQSILPHAGSRFVEQLRNMADSNVQEKSSAKPWVARLAVVSNDYIRQLNQQLAEIADEEKVEYLDLHADFTDINGDLQADLSTDGLHLSHQGYQVWQSHLSDLSRSSPPKKSSAPD